MTEPLHDTVLACESGVWEALVSGDIAADSAALAEDFLGIYPDGFSGKSDHIAQLTAGPSVQRYLLSDVRVLPLGAGHAAIVYCADFVGLGKTEASRMYVTSIWRHEAAGWINILSQDTPAGGVPGTDWV
tara:strand:+ start:67 stop:456 length:390 start_codon:yes stop_codon:yes gene_type:complete